MEVTVKTLNSQTKTFHVDAEITVQDFKKKVAEEMGIPTEKQRLIFQGKVLQDEKMLNEYKVNGCVIHLVEKQPPRNNRPNGQSTETTTSSTSSSTTSAGNMFMGAFAFPVDVMGVTQQIVQGIIQQVGAESAQANISTTSSDDGASVNVHINLSTVMSRNNARSRIGPARVHLGHVSSIVNRLQNEGMLPSNDVNEESSSGSQSGNQPDNTESTPEDLADVLQQVVAINDEMRPHLERYQELLRSSDRQLRPGDDMLPDLAAEALHSLSHAYHALSDLTTNFRMPEARLNVLPSMSPVPSPVGRAHLRTGVSHHHSPSSQSAASQTTTNSNNGTLGRWPTVTSSPAVTGTNPPSAVIVNGGGGSLFRPGGLLSGNGNRPPSSSTATSTAGPRPNNPHPFIGFPLNVRNLPNLAVQFNPASGNITIAHIMTTAVDEGSPRATTTTTNSTPAPRTSSRGSTAVPTSQGNPEQPDAERMDDSSEPPPGSTASSTVPTASSTVPTVSSTAPTASSTVPTTSSTVPTAPSTVPTASITVQTASSTVPTASSTAPASAAPSLSGGNTVMNFAAPSGGHRDPLLPCQSFHFAALTQRPRSRSSDPPASHATSCNQATSTPSTQAGQQQRPREEQQRQSSADEQNTRKPSETRRTEQQQRTRPVPIFHTPGVPTPDLIRHILDISERAANQSENQDPDNPFLEFFLPPSGTASQMTTTTTSSAYPGDLMNSVASTLAGVHRTTTTSIQTTNSDAGNTDSDADSQAGMGTLTRFLCRMAESHSVEQLVEAVLGDTASDPIIFMRSMTQEFLRTDILHGAEPTSENLQRATETLLEELQSSFDTTFSSCNVKDGIDAPETLLTYLRPKIRRILELINSTASDEVYGTEMALILTRMSVELIALTEYCLKDGITGFEAIYRETLSNSHAMSELQAAQRDAALNLSWTCLQDVRRSAPIRESSLMPFVVRKEKRKHEAKTSPKLAKKEVKKDQDTAKSQMTSESSATASTSSTTQTTTGQPEDVAMATDEDWKKVIPPEWVPVISQDIIRQHRLPRQPPFSDAYINGMPPKRRRMMTPAEPAPYNQCVSATLKRSITKSGVTPKTDIERISREASSSPTLGKVFEQEVKNEVRERLSKDSDYQSEKFPSIHKYFEKDH